MNNKNLGLMLMTFGLILLVVMVVVKINFDSQAVFLCEAVENNPDLTMEQCPAHNSNTPWLILISFGISAVIIAIGVYLFFYERTQESERSTKVDLNKLDADEKKIYTYLSENEGSAYQSDLIKETGYSKVKITRILDKLESKGITDRKRRGMTNIVFLK